MEDIIAPKAVEKSKTAEKLKGKSVYLLSGTNRLRIFFSKIVAHRYFDPVVLFFILFSTLTMTVDSPLNDPNGKLAYVLNIIDIAVTCIFSIEALLKILVNGLIMNGETSYLRNSWNIMDFIIVAFSVRFCLNYFLGHIYYL